jgi:hypothetical protein
MMKILKHDMCTLVLKLNPLEFGIIKKIMNSYTLVVLLQVDPISNDEIETIYNFFYEIEDTSIFTWFSISNVGHYCWLCGSLYRLPPNSKAYYLVCIIQCILNFLWL